MATGGKSTAARQDNPANQDNQKFFSGFGHLISALAECVASFVLGKGGVSFSTLSDELRKRRMHSFSASCPLCNVAPSAQELDALPAGCTERERERAQSKRLGTPFHFGAALSHQGPFKVTRTPYTAWLAKIYLTPPRGSAPRRGGGGPLGSAVCGLSAGCLAGLTRAQRCTEYTTALYTSCNRHIPGCWVPLAAGPNVSVHRHSSGA